MKWRIAAVCALALSAGLVSCGFFGGDGDDLDHAGGAICRDNGIRGAVLPPIREGACGIERPVRVTNIAGVALNPPAVVECGTARTLAGWVRGALKSEVGRRGGGVAEIGIAASYACRTRNSQAGARLSEHARGKAVDISSITLRDGQRITVLEGWDSGLFAAWRGEGKLLRRLHGAACGPFGTVLGPESDRFHQDHFHFDTASHRGGAYCR